MAETVSTGYLISVGLGLRLGQLTREAEQALREADVVFSVVTNSASLAELGALNANVRDLHGLYARGKPREQTYEEMVQTVLLEVRKGLRVCFAAYGHPGVFAYPPHEVVRRARAEGFDAMMLPGISAEDCLFADLGIDPAEMGCQSFDASDLIACNRIFDPRSTLIIWQPGAVGESSLWPEDKRPAGFSFLKNRLLESYAPEQEIVLYEASPFPLCRPRMERVALSELEPTSVTPCTTMVIEPSKVFSDLNEEFLMAVR